MNIPLLSKRNRGTIDTNTNLERLLPNSGNSRADFPARPAKLTKYSLHDPWFQSNCRTNQDSICGQNCRTTTTVTSIDLIDIAHQTPSRYQQPSCPSSHPSNAPFQLVPKSHNPSKHLQRNPASKSPPRSSSKKKKRISRHKKTQNRDAGKGTRMHAENITASQ